MHSRSGRVPRVKLRRHKPSVVRRWPLLQLWNPFPLTKGQDLGDRQDDHAEKDLEESQEVEDKMQLITVVRLRRSFWDDTHNDTADVNAQV